VLNGLPLNKILRLRLIETRGLRRSTQTTATYPSQKTFLLLTPLANMAGTAPANLPAETSQSTSPVYITSTSAQDFATALLTGNGVPPENATIIARCLVLADLRGVDTHGINRLPSYMSRIRAGVLSPTASPTLTNITPVVAQVDGHNGFGFLAAHAGMSAAIVMARTFGIGLVSVKHSNHFGMSAWIVQQALDAEMMSLVFTNSSPALPVWGGREKLMGVSPIACGAPSGEGGRPFILDMAPSVAARGKVYKAARRGKKIPLDWALDREGNRTDDPAKALEGVMLPMGGPKGSALAVMMDVFSGVLSGSAFAGHVTNPYDPSKPADVGHFLVAIKPDLFMSLAEFKERMQYLYERVVGSEKMAGVERIYFPGEIEQLTHEERLRTGIPYVEAEITALNKEADLVGCERMSVR
jgi:LDH2 family malate/lactate/ureidoglycolate dehydrogenase